MYYSELFLIQAALQTLLCVWLLRIWRHDRPPVALVLLLPQICLVYDNLIVGLGGTIGPGSLLEALSWPRFWTHWLFGAWAIVGCGVVLRYACVQRLQSRRGLLLFCGLTLALMVYELPHFWTAQLFAVCEFDLVRYSTAVAAGTACLADQPVVPGSPPLSSIVTLLIALGSGVVLLRKHTFPWMLVGSIVMLATTMPMLRTYKLDNLGEVFFTGGIIWALARFAPKSRA